jgi:predicted outer membrane repeat protein
VRSSRQARSLTGPALALAHGLRAGIGGVVILAQTRSRKENIMSFFSWLRNRNSSAAIKRPSREWPARKPATFRPRLESLEGRDVPSTLTVTNALDGGAGSLRYEIARAHNKDTIVFAPSLNGQTITLTKGELLITDSGLTIKGPGANLLTVSGGHASRVFEVAGNVMAAISGLTITNGSSADGGAILNGGVLTLTGCTVCGNSALLDGGGIYNSGSLTLAGCTVSGNYAADSGGGIYNHTEACICPSPAAPCPTTPPQ